MERKSYPSPPTENPALIHSNIPFRERGNRFIPPIHVSPLLRHKMAEVAGLVLAALPLLISALEHYEDAIDPITSFIHWKQELPRVIRELYMAHTSYELNLRLLLSHAVDDNAQLTDMVNDPRCDHWKSPILVGALQEHLGIAYEPGMSTIHEIAAIMIAIAQCLNISGADKVGIPESQNKTFKEAEG